MKTNCLFRPKDHIKLSPLASTPNIDDLKKLFTEVQKIRNCSIELPWAVDMVRFTLDVRINLGTQEPIWILYQGDGLQSHVAWEAPFTDIYLLREVIAISVAEIVLEHQQKKLTANAKEPSLESNQSLVNNKPFDSAYVSMSQDMLEGLQQNGSVTHSYRNMENSLASVADMVSERIVRSEQTTNKTDKAVKKPDQLLNIAELSINKAEQSINKAELSINKAEQSINKAEKSINKAEQSINKVEQIIEDISETNALASTVLHSVAKKTVNEMTETPSQDKGKNKGEAQPWSSTYAYVNPGSSYALPVTYPLIFSAAPPVNATGTVPTATASVTAKAHSLTEQPGSNAILPLTFAGSLPLIGPAQAVFAISSQSVNAEVNPRHSSLRLAARDDRLLDKQTKFLIGQFLVDSGLVPEKTLDAALKLQKMIGGNVISEEQAIDTISRVHFRNGNFDMVQLMRNSTTSGNKVNNPDFPPLGQLLVKAAVIDDPTLQATLKMQEVVRADAMSKEKACEILNKEFVASGRTKSNIDKAHQMQEKKIVDLLIEAGLINKDDKKTAQDVQKHFGGKIGEILVSAHKLSKVAYEAAFECEQLICQNKIKLEESIIALNYCDRSRVKLTDAIQELGLQIDL